MQHETSKTKQNKLTDEQTNYGGGISPCLDQKSESRIISNKMINMLPTVSPPLPSPKPAPPCLLLFGVRERKTNKMSPRPPYLGRPRAPVCNPGRPARRIHTAHLMRVPAVPASFARQKARLVAPRHVQKFKRSVYLKKMLVLEFQKIAQRLAYGVFSNP
jgi:hypothetical protein